MNREQQMQEIMEKIIAPAAVLMQKNGIPLVNEIPVQGAILRPSSIFGYPIVWVDELPELPDEPVIAVVKYQRRSLKYVCEGVQESSEPRLADK